MEPELGPGLLTGPLPCHKNQEYIEHRGKEKDGITASLDWVAGKMVMSALLLNISVAPYSLQDKA